MTTRSEAVGRALLASIGIISLVLAIAPLGGASAQAAHVPPVTVEGNPTCGSLGTWTEVLRVDPVSSNTYTASNGATIQITVRSTDDGQVFDWTSDMSMNGVFAKGGNTGNLYDYGSTGSQGDTGLHAPVNSSGKWAGLSHISFCVLSSTATTEGPTTTESPTTTVSPTSTEGPTTTEAPTTTQAPTTTGAPSTTEGPTTTEAPTTTEELSGTVVTTSTTGASSTTEAVTGQNESTTSSILEVGGITVLPFTGFGAEGFGLLALAILSSGILFLVAGRSIER